MKKNILIFVLGMVVMGGIVYAADLFIDAKSISYSSEYTESDNVADALSELLESGTGFESLHKAYPTLTIYDGTSRWGNNGNDNGCASFPTLGYKYVSVTGYTLYYGGQMPGNLYYNGVLIDNSLTLYLNNTKTYKVKFSDDETANGTLKLCVGGDGSWATYIPSIVYSLE